MTTDFFPGFAAGPHGCGDERGKVSIPTLISTQGQTDLSGRAEKGIYNVDTPDGYDLSSTEAIRSIEAAPVFLSGKVNPTAHVTSNPELYARRWDAFAFRVKQFTCSLSREHRASVARRPRFYTMPFLRRADDPDLEDTIP